MDHHSHGELRFRGFLISTVTLIITVMIAVSIFMRPDDFATVVLAPPQESPTQKIIDLGALIQQDLNEISSTMDDLVNTIRDVAPTPPTNETD